MTNRGHGGTVRNLRLLRIDPAITATCKDELAAA
jgi:hypothetical protein